jgi:hypothetical protein
VAGSVPRLSGAADTTRGARRTVAKRSAVEKCIFVLVSESLPGLLDQPAGCVVIYITKERPGVQPGYPESYLQMERSKHERQCLRGTDRRRTKGEKEKLMGGEGS